MHPMHDDGSSQALRAPRGGAPDVYRLDSPEAPTPRPALTGVAECDLAIVGAGLTGLWAALPAMKADPGRDVVAPHAGRIGGQASGSNGGAMFHYYRLTEDQRFLWGGWDAFYHYGNRIAAVLEERPDMHAKLAAHFFTTFPQLEGLRFTHRWAGVIDTCSRFCQLWGTALGGRVSYVLGYTGLGVAASRFGARVALDLVGGAPTELMRLQMVRSRPLPFPPEPLRFPLIEITRRSTAHAELHGGRRNAWLRALDRFGLGFDSRRGG